MSKSEREAIARIINPAAWMVGPSSYGLEADDHEGFMRTWGSAARLVALDKADAILALASTPPKPAAEDVVSNLIAARKKGVGMTCSGSENNRQVYRYELHFQNIKDMHEFSAAMNNLLRTDKEPS